MSISCDPQSLNAAAVCFTCIPDPLKGLVNIYLLNQLSGVNAAPAALPALSPQFQIFQGSPALAAEVYLLAKIAGASTDPSTLAGQAACFWCKNENFLQEVTTFLLATLAGGSTNAQTLMTASSTYTVLFGLQWRVELQLTCQWALSLGVVPSCDPQTLMNNSKCLQNCLSDFTLHSIRAYLLCQIASGVVGGINLVPPGSIYGPGATPEFDVPIQAGMCYQICWGANDVSAQLTVSGQTFNSTGVGTCTSLYSSVDTVLKLFGTFAGTTVTATVMNCSCGICVPPPTRLALQTDGTGNTVNISWDVAPAGTTATEIWTSTDNITYNLLATVNTPGTTSSAASVAIGSFLFVKARWIKTSIQGPFCTRRIMSGRVSDWAKRVVNNGGALPSSNSQGRAMSESLEFALNQNGGVDSLMSDVQCFPPDNLTAARTPLWHANGVDPWVNNGPFVAGDLTVNGLKGDGVAKYLDTGVNASTALGLNYKGGISLYCSSSSNDTSFEFGCADGAFAQTFDMAISYTAIGSIFDSPYLAAAGAIRVANPAWSGFLSGNRNTLIDASLYEGSSNIAFNKLGSTNGPNSANVPPNLTMYCFGINYAGGISFSPKRLSFAAFHQYLTQAQAQVLFNAVQNMRNQFGGGFV